MNADRTPWGRRLAALILLIAPGVWFYGGAFLGSGFFHRDAGHYYYPLFTWTAEHWRQGQFPLWNPHENLGVPLAADPTASLFYPAKLLLLLPWGGPVWRYSLYIALHGWAAAGACYWVARRFAASRPAAVMGALAYAYGGPVVMQYANVVYLAGAAWLPLALWSGERMLRERSWKESLRFSTFLAMIVLAGDPQSAYHAGLLAVLYAVVLWLRDRQPATVGDDPTRFPPRQMLVQRLGLLGLSGALLCLLAAVQLAPAWEWSRQTERANYDAPRNLYEALSWATADEPPDGEQASRWVGAWRGLFGTPEPGTHHQHTYLFSVGPWRLAETIWPNFSGREFPTNRRWIRAWNFSEANWTPSLYLGLGPLLLGLSAWTLRLRDPRTCWLSGILLLSVLAACGQYGLGWLLATVPQMLGADSAPALLGPQVGGVYWFLATVLPGYATFRFPAKWLVPAALALSLLAAQGMDRLLCNERTETVRRRWAIVAASLAGLSMLALIVGAVCRSMLAAQFATAPADPLYGPLQADAAVLDLLGSFAQTIALALVGAAFFWRGSSPRGAWIVAAVTAFELCAAHSWMVPLAPASQFAAAPAALSVLPSEVKRSSGDPPLRFFRQEPGVFLPPDWVRRPSPLRPWENLDWSRDTLLPKYSMLHQAEMIEVYGSSVAYDYATLLHTARTVGPLGADGVPELHAALLDLLSVDYLLLPPGFSYPGDQPVKTEGSSTFAKNARVWRNPDASPRVWLTRDVEALPPLRNPTAAQIRKRTSQVLLDEGELRDLRQRSIVEATSSPPPGAPALDLAEERPQILNYSPNEVQISAKLDHPALLVLADRYDSHWKAYAATDSQPPVELPVVRANRVLRGVFLPAGEHRVRFVYRPSAVVYGGIASGLGWLGLLAFWIWPLIVRRSQRA